MGKSIYDFGFELKKEVSFGKALRSTFKKHNLKVEHVANAAFIDKSIIYKYFRDETKPQRSTLIKLMLAADMPYDESMDLMKLLGYTLSSSNTDVFYEVLLEHSKAITVLDANEMIDLLNKEEGRIVVNPFDLG